MSCRNQKYTGTFSLTQCHPIIDPPLSWHARALASQEEELGLELAQPMGRGSHLFDWGTAGPP
jgi:hypothetical protein